MTLSPYIVVGMLAGLHGIVPCEREAAAYHQVPHTALQAIRMVEGGTVGRVNQNDNGSYDMGPMQINSLWLPTLAAYGIDRYQLIDNPCVNVFVAAWILAQEIARTGSLALGVASYHSRTPSHATRYLQRVVNQLEQTHR